MTLTRDDIDFARIRREDREASEQANNDRWLEHQRALDIKNNLLVAAENDQEDYLMRVAELIVRYVDDDVIRHELF